MIKIKFMYLIILFIFIFQIYFFLLKMVISNKQIEFFSKKVPYSWNHKLLENALKQLNLENEELEKIDLDLFSKKMIDLNNETISKALKEQELDLLNGFLY